MDKKVLHIVFVLLLVLAIPFSHVAKPVVLKAPVKHQKASQSSEESSKAFVQPQVFHVQATSAHASTPATIEPFHCEIIFPQEEVHTSSSFTLLDKGASKFFKTLFRHFIATQAP